MLGGLCGLADYYDEIVKLPTLLHLPDGEVAISTVNKNGIVCKHVEIIDLNSDRSKLPNNKAAEHHNQHGHDHKHEHSHGHQHHHKHRHLKDILAIIENGHISDSAKTIAKEIFTIVGKSEAKIHKMDLEKIHFHEISGIDSILDIVGCAILIDHLKITKSYSDPVCTGFGMVKTQHGLLPVPAPATADILINMPTYPGQEQGERVTPTGAAILKYLDPDFNIGDFKRNKIAYGPGQKDFEGPNVVRVSLVESVKKKAGSNQH